MISDMTLQSAANPKDKIRMKIKPKANIANPKVQAGLLERCTKLRLNLPVCRENQHVIG